MPRSSKKQQGRKRTVSSAAKRTRSSRVTKPRELESPTGNRDIVEGPPPGPRSRAWTPRDIEDAVVSATVGELLSRMRAESGQSLRQAGRVAEISGARVQQLERSENVEIATLVRLAAAAGYTVSITLQPLRSGLRPLRATLAGGANQR
jgi:hypothetical protein